MARWSATPDWESEDAYVIGGGDSLRSFDWSLLRGRRTVGCNSAFLLGARVCQVVIFNDDQWWYKVGHPQDPEPNRPTLATYGGVVLTTNPCFERTPAPWVLYAEQYNRDGLSDDPTRLAFGGNTGISAINYALLQGARRVFLLGFDMGLGPTGKVNWHDLRWEGPEPAVFGRFLRQYPSVARDVRDKFPGREVWNVTDGSKLDAFPRISINEHFGAVLKGER